MSLETVPKDLRHLRACLLCSLVKTIDQFEYDGCDNCESYLQMKGNREMVYECTSSSFDGIIAMMSPEDSWVAKWQRIGNFKAGVYAVTVTGRLPPDTTWPEKFKRRASLLAGPFLLATEDNEDSGEIEEQEDSEN
ncbi:Transcription elongation factor SPT4 [Bagarius yarrelli]|uniref:Transcription elongation factor SPT4 n=1 Tax=Bagarius yarrelli TaxID=175774 RepID=A0A556VB01_BAGYA|nr:Transcription elongation factor SPT4 [Bagarius yarrelli]